MPVINHSLRVDSTSEALSASLIPAVQAAYNAGPGYPPLTVTQTYVCSGAVRVGLHYWLPPKYVRASYPRGAPSNLATLAKLTPSAPGAATFLVAVNTIDIGYANAIIAAIGGGGIDDVLGCALCTGLGMLAGTLAQVGPWS